jgi:hypothetical protein
MRAEGVATCDHSILIRRRLGYGLSGILELIPARRWFDIGSRQQVFSVIPNPDIDGPGQRDVMIVVLQDIDRVRQEIVQFAVALPLADQVIDGKDRALIV